MYSILEKEGIEIPRYAILDRTSSDPAREYYCALPAACAGFPNQMSLFFLLLPFSEHPGGARRPRGGERHRLQQALRGEAHLSRGPQHLHVLPHLGRLESIFLCGKSGALKDLFFSGGGSQRLFRKIGSRSSVYSSESGVRRTGSYIYEDFMPTDGTDVKVAGPEETPSI